MISWRRQIAGGVLVLCWLSFLSEASSQHTARDAYQSFFEPSDCPSTANPAVLAQVRCGYVRVPEDRARPDGRQLRIAVAIVKSLNPRPRQDPIAYLGGGPGSGAIARAIVQYTTQRYAPLRAERDIVVLDYRGTGSSEPDFCPELGDEFSRMRPSIPSRAERQHRKRAALIRCAESLRTRGVDLSQYNAVAFAYDLEAVRRALGYARWNLWSVSFGTAVAREAMRRTPQEIRSVVLDGPLVSDPRGEYFADVLDRLLARCADDPACNRAYPRLRERFWNTLEALDREPLTIRRDGVPGSVAVDPELFVAVIFNAMYRRDGLELVPMLVHETAARNQELIAAMAAPLLQTTGSGAAGRPGVLAVVGCRWFARSNDKTRARALAVQDLALGLADWCDALRPFLPEAEPLQPVRSDIPTLVFTGEFDPTTPRSGGPVVVRTLSRSQLVEIAGGGHGESVWHDCTIALTARFIEAPERKLDDRCIAAIPALRFETDAAAALLRLRHR